MTDSDDGLENWQNRLYELHGHRCARITKSLRWLGAQDIVLPNVDGLSNPEQILVQFSKQIPESQKIEILDPAFRTKAAQWWNTYEAYPPSWVVCQKTLRLKVRDLRQDVRSWFVGKYSAHEHLEQYFEAWKHVPREEWVHWFVHTRAPVAENWYVKIELRHVTVFSA